MRSALAMACRSSHQRHAAANSPDNNCEPVVGKIRLDCRSNGSGATRTLLLKRDNGNIVTVVASSRLNISTLQTWRFPDRRVLPGAKAVTIRKSNAPRVLAEADDDPAKPIAQPVAGKPGFFNSCRHHRH